MVEIHGQISVLFKVKSAEDTERILAFCKEFEGVPAIPQHKRARPVTPGTKMTKRQRQDEIILFLQESFKEEFTLRDAVPKVFEKYGLREHTTMDAITRARREGKVMKRKRLYVWTEIVQKKVAERLQDQQQPQTSEPIAEQPIAQAPQVV